MKKMRMLDAGILVLWLKFCEIKGLGAQRVLKLLTIFQEIETLLNARTEDLLDSRVFNNQMLQQWKELKEGSSEKYEEIINKCNEHQIEILPLFSSSYPIQLKFLPEPPLTLFLQGNEDLLNTKKVAMAGSRSSNESSKKWAYNKAKELAERGFTIVSGGAKGIDYEAHRAALDVNGKTICVLGTGFLNLYPPEHIALFKEIREKGLLISEIPPMNSGGRLALLRRNRITSGISKALLQVTSSNDGGSLTQLEIAFKQRIPIFAPSVNLGFEPFDGIIKSKQKFKINELEDINSLIQILNKENFFDNQTQKN